MMNVITIYTRPAGPENLFSDNEFMDFSTENRDGYASASRPPQCRSQRQKETKICILPIMASIPPGCPRDTTERMWRELPPFTETDMNLSVNPAAAMHA